MLLELKQLFRFPLRALREFASSMYKLAFQDIQAPYYTTLCRRARDLNVVLPSLRSDEPMHLVVDSTGLKVFRQRRMEGAQTWLFQAPHLAQRVVSRC